MIPITSCYRRALEDLVYRHTEEFLERIHAPKVCVSRAYHNSGESLG